MMVLRLIKILNSTFRSSASTDCFASSGKNAMAKVATRAIIARAGARTLLTACLACCIKLMPVNAQTAQLALDAVWVEVHEDKTVKLVAKVAKELGACLPLVHQEDGLFGPSCSEPEVISEASGLTIVCSEFRRLSVEINLTERAAASAVVSNWMRERVVRIKLPSGVRSLKNSELRVVESGYDGSFHIALAGFNDDLNALVARIDKGMQPLFDIGGRRYVLLPHRQLPDMFQVFSQRCAAK